MGKPSLCWWQGVTKSKSKRPRVGASWRRGGKAGRRGRGTDGGTLLVRAPVRSSAPSLQPAPHLGSYPYGHRTSKTIFFLFVEECPLLRGESASQRVLIAQDQEGGCDRPSPALAKNPAIPQTVIPDHSCYSELLLLHLRCPSPWPRPLAPPM